MEALKVLQTLGERFVPQPEISVEKFAERCCTFSIVYPSEVRVYLCDAATDGMSAQERAALEQRLERSLAQADARDLIDADEVLDELRRP